MSALIYHMVHYREFAHVDTTKPSDTLESLLRASLSSLGASGFAKWESIEDRLYALKDGTGMDMVLNRVSDLKSAVFGEMCLIHDNAMQALLSQNSQKQKLSAITIAEIYALTEQTAPKGSRFVKGLAYFIAIGNHLFFIRTQSLTDKLIERYLVWFLTSGGANLGGGDPDFRSKFDSSVYAGDIGDIQALRISGPSFPQMQIAAANDVEKKERQTTRKVSDQFVQFEKAFEIAKTLLGPIRAEELAASLGPKERLVVDATVKVRGTRTEESKKKLSDIAKELDSMTEGKVGVEGRDGKISDEDIILRTRMPFSPIADGSSLLDFYNVADQLQLVYKRFVEDGKITA